MLKNNAIKNIILKYETSIVLSLVVLSILVVLLSNDEQDSYSIERKFRYSFTLQNKTNQLLNNVDFWVYAPVKQTSNQKLMDITASLDFKLNNDGLGNQVLHFKIPYLAPYASKVISLESTLLLSTKPVNQKLISKERFLQQEKYVEVNHPKITEVAKQFQNKNIALMARSTMEWVNKNIKYAGYIEDDRGALYSLKTRTGDCTEYMYLYTALMRNKGIPVRNIGGYVYSENKVLKAEDFHNWSEIYLDGKWQVVDPQNGTFLDNQNHYIAFRVITDKMDGTLAPSNTQRFAVSHANIAVQMN